jgi:hypothetical protein
MSESKTKHIRLAPWVVTIAASLLIAIMGLTVRGSVRVGRFEANIDNNAKEIERLDEDKANKEKLDMTYDAVIRLEKKNE